MAHIPNSEGAQILSKARRIQKRAHQLLEEASALEQLKLLLRQKRGDARARPH